MLLELEEYYPANFSASSKLSTKFLILHYVALIMTLIGFVKEYSYAWSIISSYLW